MDRLLHSGSLIMAILILSASGLLPAQTTGGPQTPPSPQAAPEALYSGVADQRAVVVSGNARFTVLTPQLIRMEWSKDGHFEDRPSLIFLNRRLAVPQFQVTRKKNSVVIETSALHLRYTMQGDGRFNAASLAVELMGFRNDGASVLWHPSLVDSGNLQGTTRTLDGAFGDKTKEPMGSGLLSRSGWSLIDDSAGPLFDSDDFTFSRGAQSAWPWAISRPAGEREDWYFFGYGHSYKQVLADYVRIAGRIPLPPRFAFGAWWSRYWAYSDQELEELAQEFRENDTPIDVFVIDMDWHKTLGMHFDQKDQSGHKLGWDGYSWNPLLFPDPAAFLGKLHRDGLKVTLNLHPASGVQPWEDQYPSMARAMGQDPAEKKYVPFDITNKRFARNYMDILHHPLEKQGVDFWWLDWQQEDDTPVAGLNPTWWLNYVHFTDQQREGKRPLLFHRWGGLGNHRYQIGFSGDTISAWESLAFQPWFTATAANVGYAYWSHDIGGHMPGTVDPELYTRWVQFGVLSPILRTHTTKNPDSERRIWAYPEPYATILRSAFQLRYALQPYIYTEARHTYDTGTAFLHPLYYDFPEAPEAYTNKDEYFFGDSMIVSPVIHPVDPLTQLEKHAIWIPEGDWIEWPSGKHFSGPATVERSFSISQLPIYVRAGAIIPMQPPMQYTGQKPVDPLILNIWPLANGHSASYPLYEDGSDSESYKRGVYAMTLLSATERNDILTIDIAPIHGSYPGIPLQRGYELRLPDDLPPTSIMANEELISFHPSDTERSGWYYDGNTLSTIIRIPASPVSKAIHIEIHRSASSQAIRQQLNGFAGAIVRLHDAYNTLNQEWPFTWSPDPIIDAWQTGDRLRYHPDTALHELSQFSQKYTAAEVSVQQLYDSTSGLSDDQLLKELKAHHSDATMGRAHHYKESLQRALAQLKDGRPEQSIQPLHSAQK